ncbi:MAG: 7-carboxy-7-deazaguanine synthase, partial [Firmicutes bacterium]|nr:7-carboxy-7-deazaguanine synthase [Bacillota bacterium]
IIEEVENYPAAHVVFTGGEPGLQLTRELVLALKEKGKFIQIETNGTVVLPEGIDWITCSPKPEKKL